MFNIGKVALESFLHSQEEDWVDEDEAVDPDQVHHRHSLSVVRLLTFLDVVKTLNNLVTPYIHCKHARYEAKSYHKEEYQGSLSWRNLEHSIDHSLKQIEGQESGD